jgi:hypothetical protein
VKTALVAIFVALASLALIVPDEDVQAQPSVIYCTGWSTDDGFGGNYWWTVETGCSAPPMFMSVAAWRGRAQLGANPLPWTVDPQWPVGVQFGPNSPDGRHASVSGSIYVTPYSGINCRRIHGFHVVTYGNTWIGVSATGTESPAVCF